MQSARALIIDRDRSFSERLGRCLRVVDVKADVVDGRREALEQIKTSVPAIVFIAVEKPKKVGFSLFSDVKRLVKTNPIVLVTSTLPSTELLLHQKLRLHADAYLDKRELTESDILATLDRVLQLNLDATDLAELSRDAMRCAPGLVTNAESSGTDESGAPDTEVASEARGSDDALGSLDPELVALLSDADADMRSEGSLDADHDDDPDCDESGSVDQLREQMEGLRRDLEIARRAASSSPFSSEYLKLSDQATRGERVSARMRRKLEERDHQNRALRSKLREIAGRLLASERARDRAMEQARKTDERLVSIEADLGRQRERGQDLERRLAGEMAKVEGLERDLRTTTQELQNRTAEYEQQSEEAVAQHRSEQAGIRTHYEATLENLREEFELEKRTLKEGHETAIKGQIEDMRLRQQMALDEQDTEWRQKHQESSNRHALALETVRKEHQNEVTELRDSMERAILRKEQETEARIRVAAAEAESVHTCEIRELEKEHLESLQALQRQYDSELNRRKTEHESTLKIQSSEMQQRQIESLESRDAAWQHRLDELGRRHERNLEAQTQEHRKKLQQAEERHQELLEETRAELKREHEAALARQIDEIRNENGTVIDSRDGEWRQRLQKDRASLERAFEEQRIRNALRIAELEAAQARDVEAKDREHAKELEAREREHAEATERAIGDLKDEHDRTGRGRSKELEQAEQTRRQDLAELQRHYRDEIGLLKKLHEAEIERLKARHAREQERMRAELEASPGPLAGGRRAGMPEPSDARLEEGHPEHSTGLGEEREEIRSIVDALEAAQSSDRAPDGETDGDSEEGTD